MLGENEEKHVIYKNNQDVCTQGPPRIINVWLGVNLGRNHGV